MKLKLNQLFFWGIIGQIVSTQGILTFLFFRALGNWEIKAMIHPLSFLIIVIAFLFQSIKKLKITPLELIVFGYLSLMSVFLIINVDSASKIYLTFREVYMIFVLTFIFNQVKVSKKHFHKFLNLLYLLSVINIFFVILTYVLGPEDYMILLTDRYKWGADNVYKFQISAFLNFWRSPGVIGSSGAMGFFALITYMLMDNDFRYKKKKFVVFLLLILSLTRSAILAFLIFFIFSFIIKKENLKMIILIGKYLFYTIIIGVVVMYQYGLFSVASLTARIYHWTNSIDVDYNPIYGGAIGRLGASARGEGMMAILDSYWIMMWCSTGLIGVLLTILFFYEKTKHSRKLMIALFSISISGFFITITQAIPFLVLFPLLFIKVNEINTKH